MDAVLQHLEIALRANPASLELIAAYREAARASGQQARAEGFLSALAQFAPAPPEDAAAVAEQTLDRARALLQDGRRDEAQALYRRLLAGNATLQDPAFEAELSGRVVRLADRGQRVASVANDDDEAASIARLVQPPDQRVTFADVGGLDEIKTQVRRKIITPFEKPSLFARFRKRAGGGVLMYGPPGCGKTLLARATAGECGATFLNIAISDVLDLYIGESERKLHALFDQARRTRPTVMFFDEVEALGGRRQGMREAGASKLVSQFLSELDGFAQNNDGVLVLAATNVPWSVDPAFRRPGRFDRVLFVPPPDLEARHSILRALLAGRPCRGEVDIGFLARNTPGFSGADLRELVERAVDEAIEESIAQGVETGVDDERLKQALKSAKPTTLEWFATARNYARYANEGGQYDDVLRYIETRMR